MNIYVHKDGLNYGPHPRSTQEYLQQGSFPYRIKLATTDKLDPRRSVPGMTRHKAPRKPESPPTKSKQFHNPSTAQVPANRFQRKKTSGRKRLFTGQSGKLDYRNHRALLVDFSGDDETKEAETQLADANKSRLDTSEEISSDDSESASNTPSIQDTPLIERIPSDAGAVLLIRINDLLEKGRKISPPCPPELPPMAGKAIDDQRHWVGPRTSPDSYCCN